MQFDSKPILWVINKLSKFKLVILILCIPFISNAQDITFHRHIAPIIYSKCSPCHQKNNIGAMSLTSYEEVSAYATMIQFVTSTRYMPPWKVVQSQVPIHGDRKLSDAEIKLINDWINSGMPEGDATSFKFQAAASKPQLKSPDAVYAMEESFEQYGVYYDQYRVFVIPTNLTEDKEVAAIEFIPGNKSLVRNCFISVDTTSKSKALDEWDPQYGYFSFGEIGFVPMESRWYNWSPGKKMTVYPKGYGKRLPKNAKLLLHIHYGPTGVPQKDSSRINIKFAKAPLTQAIYTAPLINLSNLTNPTFSIEANDSIRFHAKFIVPFDIELHGLFPQSHYLGRRWEIFSVTPDRKSEVLLKINDWDFHWRQMYDFKEKIVLKKGTVIHAMALYDNTINNPLNPSDPPRAMEWGKRMYEEMFIVYFSFSQVNMGEADFELSANFTNTTFKKNHFQLALKTGQRLTASIKNFDGTIHKILFENQSLKKGIHQMAFDLDNFKPGNYFIEVTKAGEQSARRHIFLYLEDQLFE